MNGKSLPLPLPPTPAPNYLSLSICLSLSLPLSHALAQEAFFTLHAQDGAAGGKEGIIHLGHAHGENDSTLDVANTTQLAVEVDQMCGVKLYSAQGE